MMFSDMQKTPTNFNETARSSSPRCWRGLQEDAAFSAVKRKWRRLHLFQSARKEKEAAAAVPCLGEKIVASPQFK